MKIILGSKSPRRKELLENMQIEFTVDGRDIPEDIISYDNPKDYVIKTATKKGEIICSYHLEEAVLCADTIVVHKGKILEKPKDKDDARRMITELQDSWHSVFTAVYLSNKDIKKCFLEETKVHIAKMSVEEIEEYINTKEPYDKAGAYAIQGLFCRYIEKIEGDFYNVMGLPIHKVYSEMKKMGIN